MIDWILHHLLAGVKTSAVWLFGSYVSSTAADKALIGVLCTERGTYISHPMAVSVSDYYVYIDRKGHILNGLLCVNVVKILCCQNRKSLF